MRMTETSKSNTSRYFATITVFFSNKIVSERMENFHYLNGVKCLQLAHDCAHVIFPQTLKIQYGGPQAINSMGMSGS